MIALGMTVLLSSLPDAAAHRDDQSYLYLDVGVELGARLQMPFGDVETVFGIEIDITGSEEEIAESIEANREILGQYALDHVTLGSGGEEWDLQIREVAQAPELPFVQVSFDVDTNGPIPVDIDVTLDPFFDEIDERDALMLIGNDWKRGVIDSEANQLVLLTPDSRSATATLGDSSQWKNLWASMTLGLDHIRTGPDHMLFIVALLLPSVLIWRDSWKPAKGFLSTLWRLTKVLTMFTLAHSVTFTLTGIGAVPSPGPKVTETIIALSIAATALHTLRPILANREWIIALVFGLFHGFGFASLVQDLEVDQTTELVSLAGRNIGIEIGQLFVVLLTFPVLFLLRRTKYYRPFLIVGCIGLIIVSIGWAIERVWGGRTITTSVIDKVTDFPRVLIFLAIATAIAGGLFMFERSKDRLLEAVSRREPVTADA